MKRIFSFLLIIAIVCASVVPCFAANPSVSIKTSSTATVGEIITVSVNLSANSGLAGIQFAVNFNNSEFELVKGSAQASSLFTAIPVEKTSSVEFSGVSVNAVNSSGAILTFKLKVLKTGGAISIKILDAINGDNQTVSVSTSGATVKCSHANAKWTVTKSATCKEKGSEKGTCTCGDTLTRDVAMLSHDFDAWKITSEATETQTGLKERICKVCGKKETAVIGKVDATETITQTETETETTTQAETKTETTTEQQTQDIKNDKATPIVVGIVLFFVGFALGIGVTLLVTKHKTKEE